MSTAELESAGTRGRPRKVEGNTLRIARVTKALGEKRKSVENYMTLSIGLLPDIAKHSRPIFQVMGLKVKLHQSPIARFSQGLSS